MTPLTKLGGEVSVCSVRTAADRCLVDTVTDCMMWQAMIFTLEELASLLHLHKPADLLMVGKAEAFLCFENLPSRLAGFLLSSARFCLQMAALIF